MIYPVAVIVIALVVGVILWKVIPTFATLFAGLGAELPLPTRIVIAAEQRLGALHAVRDRRSASALSSASALLRDAERPAVDRRVAPEAAGAGRCCARSRWRASAARCRRCSLGRADSRRPGDHRADRRQRHRRGRDHGHAQEHRARRDDRRRRSRRPRCSRRWSCR